MLKQLEHHKQKETDNARKQSNSEIIRNTMKHNNNNTETYYKYYFSVSGGCGAGRCGEGGRVQAEPAPHWDMGRAHCPATSLASFNLP